MSPALNGSSAIRRFKGSDVIEIRNGITFDFYTGLPLRSLKLITFDGYEVYKVHKSCVLIKKMRQEY